MSAVKARSALDRHRDRGGSADGEDRAADEGEVDERDDGGHDDRRVPVQRREPLGAEVDAAESELDAGDEPHAEPDERELQEAEEPPDRGRGDGPAGESRGDDKVEDGHGAEDGGRDGSTLDDRETGAESEEDPKAGDGRGKSAMSHEWLIPQVAE